MNNIRSTAPEIGHDLETLVIEFHGPPAFSQLNTGPRPADRREMVSAMPELACFTAKQASCPGLVHGEPRRVLRGEAPGRCGVLRGEADRRRAARVLAAFARAWDRHDKAYRKFEAAASFPGRGTRSGMTLRAERLERALDPPSAALGRANDRALRALRDLGCEEGQGGVRCGGRLYMIQRPFDNAQVVRVVVVDELVDLDAIA